MSVNYVYPLDFFSRNALDNYATQYRRCIMCTVTVVTNQCDGNNCETCLVGPY